MNTLANILVVDDSANDVFLLEQAFKKAAATSRLYSVQDGIDARAYLKGEGVFSDRAVHPFPDLLLLDLNMPRMNGFEFLQWLRTDDDCSQLVIYVLSASARDADVHRAYRLGANSYVVKPSRMDELVSFVAAMHQWHRFTVLPSQPALRSALSAQSFTRSPAAT
ncbi:MAG TPA: response regulator [Verrucomicrobiae bacterium]|nr:response regulator [Verrucomicrobiae bacterium]